MPKVFRFKIDNQTVFETPLQSIRCIATTKNNHTQCKHKCVIGEDLCYVHLLYTKHLRIKKSTIPAAELGLFAMDKSKDDNEIIFKKGQTLCQYLGEVVTMA